MCGVDGLDGADEVDLRAEGGEETGFIRQRFREGQGREAEEVVELLPCDLLLGSMLGRCLVFEVGRKFTCWCARCAGRRRFGAREQRADAPSWTSKEIFDATIGKGADRVGDALRPVGALFHCPDQAGGLIWHGVLYQIELRTGSQVKSMPTPRISRVS